MPSLDIIVIQQNGEFYPSRPIGSMGLVNRGEGNQAVSYVWLAEECRREVPMLPLDTEGLH